MSNKSEEKADTFDSFFPKRVSFCLVTKNKAPHLAEALNAYRSSGIIKPEDELIIIDGNSTDQTKEVIRKFLDIVSVFISEPDISGEHALNKAILLSRGKYIKLITDDDMFHAEALEKAVVIMETYPEIDMLLTGGTKEKKGVNKWNYYAPAGADYGKSVEDVFRYQGANGCGQLVRKSAYAKTGMLCPVGAMFSDKLQVIQFIRAGAIVKFCRINSFHHKIYDHSVLNLTREKLEKEILRLAKQYCSKRFYWQYRTRAFIRGHPRLHKITSVLGLYKSEDKKPSFPWDGGFS